MFKRMPIAALVGLVGLVAGFDSALAASCAQLENMLRQGLASGHQGKVVIANQGLARQGCRGAQVRPGRRLGSRMLVFPQFNSRAAPDRRDARRQADPARRQSAATGSVGRRSASRDGESRRERAERSARWGKTYRTWCVRSCDGYYFPISYSTTRQQFAADQASCEQMCPGSSAELFVQPAGESGRESMQSIAGEPYVALPTAFQYRTGINPSCTCSAAQDGQSSALLQTMIPSAKADPEVTGPLPQSRPAPGDDPESIANRLGSFTPGANYGTPSVAQTAPGGLRQVLAGQEKSTGLVSAVPSAGVKDDAMRQQMLLLLPNLMLGRVPTL